MMSNFSKQFHITLHMRMFSLLFSYQDTQIDIYSYWQISQYLLLQLL